MFCKVGLKLFKKALYFYSKLVVKLQYPSIKDSIIHKTAKIGARSNVVRINMDKYSYMGNNNSVMDTNIGKFCSIASYCSIGGGEHPINWVSTSSHFYSSKKNNNKKNTFFCSGKPVNIGNDVWIGEKCFIKSGVKIGHGAIIGAHTIVTKDVPEYSIVVGAPAKIIGYRFEPETISQLLKIKWWDFDDDRIADVAKEIDNPKKIIAKFRG